MNEHSNEPGQDADTKRREALAKIAKFGAFTAPVVLGMLRPTKAVAQTHTGGGGGCCWTEAMLASGERVGAAMLGAPLLMMLDDGSGTGGGAVERTRASLQPCLSFCTETGITLTLSESTPIPVRRQDDIDYLSACDVLAGDVLPVQDANGFRWEKLVRVDRRGVLPVSLLSAGNGVYAAGDEPGRLIFTHNIHDKD